MKEQVLLIRVISIISKGIYAPTRKSWNAGELGLWWQI